jgi:L-serine dehydratase
MAVSAFDLFKIGIGPSSSHTVGPMRAARMFGQRLLREGLLFDVRRVQVQLYGSLGATGKGHGSDKAVLLGLAGHAPENVDVERISSALEAIRTTGSVQLIGRHAVAFDEAKDLIFHRRETLPFHANGMICTAFNQDSRAFFEKTYYSVGGGFVVSGELSADRTRAARIVPDATSLPMGFTSGAGLLELCSKHQMTIAQIMRMNERHWRQDAEIDAGLLNIWNTMQSCVVRGCATHGVLPGGFKVKRRAPDLYSKLSAADAVHDPLSVMDWVNLYALAVNEENAAGGRVVTAPTNGAAGIIPAVLHYYTRHTASPSEQGVIDFLLTAAAIGILYKENASISGAEVGCQGEVGVACSMAAGALCAVMGGTPAQVENAAEIGMEHHLGLTCDPVGGLVQIPCIERNAIASVKAINAARMALHGDGSHYVSLDKVIKTMRETGADMNTKYKETARGGLAVNIVEC